MTPIILFWTSVIAIIIVHELGGNIAMNETIIAALIGCAGGILTTYLAKRFDFDKIKERIDSRSSQSSVDQLSKGLETSISQLFKDLEKVSTQSSIDQLSKDLGKVSTEEHLDRKFTEVSSSFSILSEKMNANQRETSKSLDHIDNFLDNVRSAATDAGSVKEAFATVNALISDNGQLRKNNFELTEEINRQKSIIRYKENELNSANEHLQQEQQKVDELTQEISCLIEHKDKLSKELQASKETVQSLSEENEALKQDCIQLEKEYNRIARQMRYEKDGPEMSM